MINVYYGGADREKDRFLFDRIVSRMPADTVLLVPDQFTLQAERNAFRYMNTDTLLELEIMSRSGFIRRIVSKAGQPHGTAVNKYGRYMLLAKLMLQLEDEEENKKAGLRKGESREVVGQVPVAADEGIFAAVRRKRSFLTMLNDQISELKQFNVTPDDLLDMMEALSDEDLLTSKLRDIHSVYELYEEELAGSYIDTEDHLQAVIEKIGQVDFVKNTIFWIDGFDYMTPKLISMIEAIAGAALEVNVILTGRPDSGKAGGPGLVEGLLAGESARCFMISDDMRRQLREAAERCGTGYSEEAVPAGYHISHKPEIRVMSAADMYSEAESIAIDITRLVREKGLRYSDIAIICNDAEGRGSIFRRIFDIYGIPLFIDRKRSIMQDPAVTFIISMLDIIRKNRRFDDVFRMLRTGFGPVTDDECDELEKYCRKYKIRSWRWKTDFTFGIRDEGQEKLERLNLSRRRVDDFVTAAEKLFKGKKTVTDRCRALYAFLTETVRMPQICADSEAGLLAEGMNEAAESISQIWDKIVDILDQMAEVIGEAELSDEAFNEILEEGFSEVELGLIPTSSDQVIFGTMQRTRTGSVRAMFAAGANEGVLPESGRTESLLSDEEKQLISEKARRISKTDELRVMEQDLAIYKNLSRASEYLTVSWAELGADGSVLRPSELVEDIIKAGKEVKVIRDYISSGNTDAMLQTPGAASGHAAIALRKSLTGGELDDIWKAAALALDGTGSFETARKGLIHATKEEVMDRELVRELFGKGSEREIILSASALEKYSRCPFSFFVGYGLRPEEERSFQVDMRSIGDIYHECLRLIAAELSDGSDEVCSPESGWMTITDTECRDLISSYVDRFAQGYREGIFSLDGRESYIRERIKAICFTAAWLMIEQVRSGRVKEIYFEQSFGKNASSAFPPVRILLEDGSAVFLEGKIDRIDIISGWDEDSGDQASSGRTARDFVRIIDYKSGNEKFSIDEVKEGWRLQLMIYLKGAMGAIKGSRPAGVFYFAVGEPDIDVSATPQAAVKDMVEKSLLRTVRLDGVLLDNVSVITGMDQDFDGYSEIIPVRRLKDGSCSGNLLTDAEFDELIQINDENLRDSAQGLVSGCVTADPKKGIKSDACRFCTYHSICRRE